MHAEPSSHWLHETFITKTIHHHFWPGLMAGAETMVQSLHQLPWVCLSKVFDSSFLDVLSVLKLNLSYNAICWGIIFPIFKSKPIYIFACLMWFTEV
jgi:hypothetical protein